jgi:hypothetical protein
LEVAACDDAIAIVVWSLEGCRLPLSIDLVLQLVLQKNE